MKKLETARAWGLIIAALCGTAGAAMPIRAEETAHGTGKSTSNPGAFRIAPGSRGTVITNAPTGRSSDAPLPGPRAGRRALGQPQCSICLGGSASAQWTGGTGSFHIDRVENDRSSGVSGPLDLKMVLTASQPVWPQTIYSNAFSATVTLDPLAAGYMYEPVDSGSISYFGSSMPAGEYFLLMFLREYVNGGWHYVDWVQMDKKVSCNGSACATVNSSSCTEDTYTMCLLGGRYRVTGRWKNQYAGGAEANLTKAKLTDVTGAFWIADANTYEFMIRVNTATTNGRAWMAILTFTDVEFWVAVTDVTNGQSKEYHSAPGNRTLIYDPYFFVYP